ncbi:MAG: hypothetical protein OXQ96_04705, partial [Alphaproteobacteria bacterium]|nr:hypothetical protein [Alphaproteobacteria bacterium]
VLVLFMGAGVGFEVWGQTGISNRSKIKTERQLTDVRNALDGLVTEATRLGQDLSYNMTILQRDFENLRTCADRGYLYPGQGTNCFTPRTIDHEMIRFGCTRGPGDVMCPNGYYRRAAGRTTDSSNFVYSCGSYCASKVGYVCVWWGYMYRSYAHCERYKAERNYPNMVDPNIIYRY